MLQACREEPGALLEVRAVVLRRLPCLLKGEFILRLLSLEEKVHIIAQLIAGSNCPQVIGIQTMVVILIGVVRVLRLLSGASFGRDMRLYV